MKSIKICSIAALMSFALLFALLSQQQTGVEAGKKKYMKGALMAALLMSGGKKILFPLPIPVPVPVLKQTVPVYMEHHSSHGGHESYGGHGGHSGGY